ncbi:MAG: polysaccharide biosynthesis tyrosine autokinase [Bacteroidetes bacterium]|nr:polysaccharide biosynthesis tyrosine autokinase [Bacteroidota bacterium]
MNTNGELPVFEESVNEAPDLKETIYKYLGYWKWYVLSIIVFLTLGYIYGKLSTPLYKIETELLIKDNKDNKLSDQNDLLKDLGLFSSDKVIDNEIQVLESKTILEKVIKYLKLQTSYITSQGIREKETYGNVPFEADLISPSVDAYKTTLPIKLVSNSQFEINGKRFPVNMPTQTDAGVITVKPTGLGSLNQMFEVKFNDLGDLIESYSKNLKIDPVSKQATVLIITLEDEIPQRGKDFLNRLIAEYNIAALEDKNQVTANTLDFIDKRIKVIASELGKVEKNVQEYKSSNKITDISSESQIFLQGVQDNDEALNKVQIQISVLNNLENYINKNYNDPSTVPSMLGIDDPTLLGLVQQLGDAELKRLSLLQTATETNPMVATYTEQIDALKKAIKASVANLKNGLEITKQQLQQKNAEFEQTIKQVPDKERGLLDVMRQQDIQNTLYTYLLQKHEETAMQLASDVADSRTIDPATSSKNPVKPIKSVIYLSFFLVGLILPTCVVYFRGILNDRINRRSDIERITRVPIIAEISYSSSSSTLLIVDKPRSMVSEQIRALRTNLQFVLPNENQKIILFTSSISGEGKSFISLNLGASLAMSGKKVIILEFDLRKPKLHVGLDIDNKHGLSTYLIGKDDYHDVINPIPTLKDYYLITSGPIPPNPAELIGNGRLQKLFADLKKDFDYIIIDAPPIGLVTDAQLLGKYADATMFIVRHNYTAKNFLHTVDELYKYKKFNNLNLVMNSIKMEYTYGYGYGYGYGYNGYYHEEESVSKSSGLSRLFNDKTKS